MPQNIDPNIFVVRMIQELLQIGSQIETVELCEPDINIFRAKKGADVFDVRIPNNILSDLKGASDNVNSEQFIVLKNTIEFKIHTQLLKQYALPSTFRISEKLINEKRNWRIVNPIELGARFNEELCNRCKIGLKKLEKYLESKSRTLNLSPINNELGVVKNLLEIYDKKNSYVKSEMLTFLKAALVCEIINLEQNRKETNVQNYLKAITDGIISLVDALRDSVFLDIKLPDCMRDYANDVESGKFNPLSPNGDIVPFGSNKVIFLARKFNDSESGKMKQIIESEFAKEGYTIQEGEVKDCGYVSEDILNKIKTSSFFIALITPVNELKSGKFSTSTWVLMETGAAVAFGRKIIPMVDESVDDYEYSGKLQRDCQYETFSKHNFGNILKKVVLRIKNEYNKNGIIQ